MAFELKSTAFDANGLIPGKYTCDGQNISPPLKWDEILSGTKSLALIMDDPDAPVGTWDHWVLFNIPLDTKELPEAVRALPEGTKQGANSWNKRGYGGPCPPDREHRYFFKLYALDCMLDLASGVGKKALEKAMQGHILGKTELVGRYDRHR